MLQRNVSAVHLTAVVMWICGFVLIVAAVNSWPHAVGMLGLFLAGVGGVLNIRAMLYHAEERVKNLILVAHELEPIDRRPLARIR